MKAPVSTAWPALAGVIALAGCTLAPPYRQPGAPVPDRWTSSGARAVTQAEATAPGQTVAATDLGWRDFFSDPRLQRVIGLALENNRDLRIAALNVQAADATYRVQHAGLFPTLDLTGVQQTERIPAAVLGATASGGSSVIPAAAGAGAAAGGSTGGSITERYANVGVGFSAYELDLFGRIRSLSRAALEQYFADEQIRRSTQLGLVAQVANAWLAIAADVAILKVTRETLNAQTSTLDLTRRTLDAGTGTALALRQAESTVATARANLASYTRELAQDRNALMLLVGAPLPADLEFAEDPTLIPPQELSPGLPSLVLTRRPDVLAAEHQLRAANANIGAARAAFFPRIALTGIFGTASTELSGLFRSGSQAWSFSPSVTLPLFTGGANVANLDLARLQTNVYVAQYEKAIQSAFREVDDALSARATLDEQLAAQRALVAATADAYRLADLRFRGGVDTFLTVLDAERSLYAAQQALVGVELLRSQNLATLYKALGGGLRDTHAAR